MTTAQFLWCCNAPEIFQLVLDRIKTLQSMKRLRGAGSPSSYHILNWIFSQYVTTFNSFSSCQTFMRAVIIISHYLSHEEEFAYILCMYIYLYVYILMSFALYVTLTLLRQHVQI